MNLISFFFFLFFSAQVELVRRAMAGFSLPAINIPEWAKDLSEDEWQKTLETTVQKKKWTLEIMFVKWSMQIWIFNTFNSRNSTDFLFVSEYVWIIWCIKYVKLSFGILYNSKTDMLHTATWMWLAYIRYIKNMQSLPSSLYVSSYVIVCLT